MNFVLCALIFPLMVTVPTTVESNLALDVFFGNCDKYDTDDLGFVVCGNDGKTYSNFLYLSCLNYKLKKHPAVKMHSFGPCPGSIDKTGCPWYPFYEPVCGSDGKTYVNEARLICVANETGEEITVEKKCECKEEDPCCKDEELSTGPKVCASNGLTYPSARVVQCLSKHDADLDILHEGGCSVSEVAERYPTRERVCNLGRHHYEHNPVCGQNNISYLNPFIFLCYSPMGEAIFSGGDCNCSSYNACQKAIEIDREYEECKKNVILNEVCGYDGLTYRSKYHLLCAARNNSLLIELHVGRCKYEDSPCLRAKLSEGFPVCGSDGVTYANLLSLFCIARNRDPSLKFVHAGKCVRRRNRSFNLLNLSATIL